jgi:hypothetical protein
MAFRRPDPGHGSLTEDQGPESMGHGKTVWTSDAALPISARSRGFAERPRPGSSVGRARD